MNKLFISLLGAALFFSCAQPDVSSELGRKKLQRDSLKTQIEELAVELSTVEEWIAAHDTSLLKKLPLVTTIPFMLKDYGHYVEVHGTVKAGQNASLYSTMGGEIQAIKVRQGAKVKKGQLLVSVDAGALNQNINQMRSQLKLAEDVLRRQENLWVKQKIGSEMQYLEAQTNVESMKASIKSMEAQVRSSQIYAPFSGVVDEIFPNVGDMANPTMPIIRLVALGKSTIEADVAEEYLSNLSEGDPVDVIISRGDTMKTTIAQIGSFINPGNRTFKVTCKAPDGVKLRPNQLTTVRIQNISRDSSYVLSPRLLMEDASGNSYVYVLNETGAIPIAEKVYVERVKSSSNEVLIKNTEELKPGDLIIDQGSRLVIDAQKVRVREQS